MKELSPVWKIAVHVAVAGDVFDGVFLCCPFFHKMSWMRSGTELSPFLRGFYLLFQISYFMTVQLYMTSQS